MSPKVLLVSDVAQIYWVVFATRFKTLLQYRAAAIAGVVTQIFWGSVKLMILGAFYAQASEPPPISFAEVVIYVWLGQVLLGLLPWNPDPELDQLFRTGDVSYELLRPLNLYVFWYARILAFRTAPTLLRLIPGLIFAMLLLPLLGLEEWQLHPPDSIEAGLLFCLSMIATVILSCTFTIFIAGATFWMLEGRGVSSLMNGIVAVFSGMVIPLPLFPDWLQPILYWQPFRGLCDIPYRIYSGHIDSSAAFGEIGFQFVWAAILILLTYWMFSHAQQRAVVQGG